MRSRASREIKNKNIAKQMLIGFIQTYLPFRNPQFQSVAQRAVARVECEVQRLRRKDANDYLKPSLKCNLKQM